jgi:hypothetical protein
MSAIKFNEVIDFIRENDCCHIKVLGLDKTRICEYVQEDGTTDGAIAYLESKRNVLSAYHRVKIIGTTNSGKSQNWTNAFNWIVQLDNNLPVHQNSQDHTSSPRGFISSSEASIMAQFEALKLELKYNEQLRDLREKLKAKDETDPMLKYLPLAPLFIKDKEKIGQIMGIAAAMSGKSFQQSGGIAGAEQNTVIQKQMTEQELDEKLVVFYKNIETLLKHKDVGLEKLSKIIDKAIEKPELVNTLLTFI